MSLFAVSLGLVHGCASASDAAKDVPAAAATPATHTAAMRRELCVDVCVSGPSVSAPVVQGSTITGSGSGNGSLVKPLALTTSLYRNGTLVASTTADTSLTSVPSATAYYVCPSGSTTASYYTVATQAALSSQSATVSLTCTVTCNQDTQSIPPMPESAFCKPIPASPSPLSNSSTILAYYAQNQYGGTPQKYEAACCSGFFYQFGGTASPPPAWATQSAVYWASSSDPSYTIDETGAFTTIDGLSVNIPNGAYPEGYGTCPTGGWTCVGDGHMSVIDPTRTYEYDFFEVTAIGGGVIKANSAVRYTLATTDGFGCQTKQNCVGDNATASGRALSQGLVLPKEILSGSINHALAITVSCSNGTYVAPATGSDNPCASTASGMAEGQRFFLAACSGYPSCTASQSYATINSWGLPAPTVLILEAMANYGMYYTDSGDYGSYIQTLDPHSYWTSGDSHPLSNSWPAVGSQFGLGAYPQEYGMTNYGYDLDFASIPTNPNGPSGTNGLWSWLVLCSSGSC